MVIRRLLERVANDRAERQERLKTLPYWGRIIALAS